MCPLLFWSFFSVLWYYWEFLWCIKLSDDRHQVFSFVIDNVTSRREISLRQPSFKREGVGQNKRMGFLLNCNGYCTSYTFLRDRMECKVFFSVSRWNFHDRFCLLRENWINCAAVYESFGLFRAFVDLQVENTKVNTRCWWYSHVFTFLEMTSHLRHLFSQLKEMIWKWNSKSFHLWETYCWVLCLPLKTFFAMNLCCWEKKLHQNNENCLQLCSLSLLYKSLWEEKTSEGNMILPDT